MSDVGAKQLDLKQLAVDRERLRPTVRARRAWISRYVLPPVLIFGFAALVAWTSRGLLIPPRNVQTIPVLATQSAVQAAGTPLFQAAGWVEPRPTPVRVAALAHGIVEQLLVVEDEPVRAGQPVAELIKDDARLAYDAALADQQLRMAELEQAQAALTAAVTRFKQPVHLEAALGEANAEVARIDTMLNNLPFETQRAKAQLRFAEEDYRGKLSAKQAVSTRTVDAAFSELESSRALVGELQDREQSLRRQAAALAQRSEALQTQLSLLADEIKDKDEAAANVKAARARLEQSRVAVTEAQLRLDRMTVRSPMDGRVYQLVGHPGADTSAVMTAMNGHDARTIVTLYRPDMLQIRVDTRFEDIPKVSLNQPVQIENPAISSPLIGRVLYISSEADIQKNTLQVKVAIESAPEVFKPEMLVDVTFLAPEQTQNDRETTFATRFYVPHAFVHNSADGPFVWVADQSVGRAIRTPVELGVVQANGLVEIKSGLRLATRILTTGTDGLVDGDRIRVTGESQDDSALSQDIGAGQGDRRYRPLNRSPTGGQ